MSIRKLISPENIRTDLHYFDTFDHSETEQSARVLMMFLKERGNGWEPFTEKELNQWYRNDRKMNYDFCFNRLLNYWNGDYSPLVRSEDGVITIQERFISRVCSNPSVLILDGEAGKTPRAL